MVRKIIYIVLFLVGCRETVTLDLPEGEPRLVIEARITDQPGPYLVHLQLSTSFDEPATGRAVENAQIQLMDDLGNEETLNMIAPGIFQTSSIQGTVGVNYTLEVTYEGITYRAQSQLKPVGAIDSLSINFSPETIIREEGYYVSLYAQKSSEDEVNYYRWRLFRNDSLFSSREFLYVDSDEFGATLEGLEFDYPFDPGDTVKCEMESLTKDAYDYYIQLRSILNSDGIINRSRSVNPPTNFSPEVIGLFQTSAVSSEEVIIEN